MGITLVRLLICILNNPLLYYLYCIVFFQYHKSPIIGVKSTNLNLERVLSPEPIVANVPPNVIIIIVILILHLVDQNTLSVTFNKR